MSFITIVRWICSTNICPILVNNIGAMFTFQYWLYVGYNIQILANVFNVFPMLGQYIVCYLEHVFNT